MNNALVPPEIDAHNLKPGQIVFVLGESIKLTATIVFIIIGALAFGHWITSAGIAEALVQYVKGLDLKALQFLLFINILMLGLVFFMGIEHPPALNDLTPIGTWRKVLGYVALALFFLLITPDPFGF